MSVSKNRGDEFLLAAQVMIENALSDNVVKTALAAYGFTENKLTEIKKRENKYNVKSLRSISQVCFFGYARQELVVLQYQVGSLNA